MTKRLSLIILFVLISLILPGLYADDDDDLDWDTKNPDWQGNPFARRDPGWNRHPDAQIKDGKKNKLRKFEFKPKVSSKVYFYENASSKYWSKIGDKNPVTSNRQFKYQILETKNNKPTKMRINILKFQSSFKNSDIAEYYKNKNEKLKKVYKEWIDYKINEKFQMKVVKISSKLKKMISAENEKKKLNNKTSNIFELGYFVNYRIPALRTMRFYYNFSPISPVTTVNIWEIDLQKLIELKLTKYDKPKVRFKIDKFENGKALISFHLKYSKRHNSTEAADYTETVSIELKGKIKFNVDRKQVREIKFLVKFSKIRRGRQFTLRQGLSNEIEASYKYVDPDTPLEAKGEEDDDE